MPYDRARFCLLFSNSPSPWTPTRNNEPAQSVDQQQSVLKSTCRLWFWKTLMDIFHFVFISWSKLSVNRWSDHDALWRLILLDPFYFFCTDSCRVFNFWIELHRINSLHEEVMQACRSLDMLDLISASRKSSFVTNRVTSAFSSAILHHTNTEFIQV